MRPLYVSAIVIAAASPIVVALGLDWLTPDDVGRVVEGEDARAVGAEIARREFTPRVELAFLGAHDRTEEMDAWGGPVHAEQGQVYRHLSMSVKNVGRLDVSVHTWHFSLRDDANRTHKSQVGLETAFEVMGLRSGESATGEVVFLLPTDARIASIRYEGEIANATLEIAGGFGGASSAPTQPPPPQEKPDP